MGLHYSPIAWHRDFDHVARYYETRLAGLLRLAEELRVLVCSHTQELSDDQSCVVG
jgi:hypothetical protein